MSDNILDRVFDFWKSCDFSGAYQAGFTECRGKMFIPYPSLVERTLDEIDSLRTRLNEIDREDLRILSEKLLSGIEIDLKIQSPERFVGGCFMSLWFSLLMNEQKVDDKSLEAVDPLLEQSVEILQIELERWRGHEFSGEVIKSTVDNCNSLAFILDTLEGQHVGSYELFTKVRTLLAEYRQLFPFPVEDPQDFRQLFAFFKEKSTPPKANEFYSRILSEMYDFGATAEVIETETMSFLDDELAAAREVIPKFSKGFLDLPLDASLGQVYGVLTEKYEIKSEEVLQQAKRMMEVINTFIDRYIQDLGTNPDITPIEAPKYLSDLITSGATVPLNFATPQPKSIIYINKEKNASFLTLLNVLVHEASHAYHPLILAHQSLPELARLKLSYTFPFSEATAFHREFELFEAVSEQSTRAKHNSVQQKLIDLFDIPSPALPDDVLAFEFETRYWRIIRGVRTLCDVQLNTGRKNYVEFLEWASDYTGFSTELINDECFTFLGAPGYMPSYSFCGNEYEALEREASKHGIAKLEFNSRANQIGLWPWTVCLKKMGDFFMANRQGS
jgi:hypothetical protein